MSNITIVRNDLSTKEGQNKLKTQLKSVLGQARLISEKNAESLFSPKAMEFYWIPAFTSKSVTQRIGYNYESLEAIGDKIINTAFVDYVRKLYKTPSGVVEISQQQITLLVNKYMSQKFQIKLANELGFSDLIYYDEKITNLGSKILEDVFESFFGALFSFISDTMNSSVAYSYVFNMLLYTIRNENIDAYENLVDPVTQLKEIWTDAMRSRVKYDDTPNEGRPGGRTVLKLSKADGTSVKEFVYRSDSDNKSERKVAVAQQALDYLQEQGIFYPQEINKRNLNEAAKKTELGLAMSETFTKIDELNETQMSDYKIIVFETKTNSVPTSDNSLEFVANLKLGYAKDNNFNDVKWTLSPYTAVGKTDGEARVSVLKKFINSF